VGSSPGRVKPRTIKLVFVASPLRTQHYGKRAKIGWLGIRIMCPNIVTFLPAEYTLSQYDSSPPLTACTIVVIPIDSSFAEQVEEYTCLNTDCSEILVSNIA
jgi:hypothetical protein